MSSNPKIYVGPKTGRVYDFNKGDKIDAEAEGIGCSGQHKSPDCIVNGKKKYARIFIRRRTPAEILSRLNVSEPEVLQRQIECVVAYIIDFSKSSADFELRFECVPLLPEETTEQ